MNGFLLKILRYTIHALRYTVSAIRHNRILTGILACAVLLRIIGLFPHDIYNADEKYIRDKSAALFFGIVTNGDFDPHTYKYGSFIFYWGSMPYFIVYPAHYISDGMSTARYTVSTSGASLFAPNIQATRTVSFREYIQTVGPDQWAMTILRLQRLSIALLGSLTVYVVYLIGKQLLTKETSLIAAAILAVSPLHVRDSHYLTTDIPFTLAIVTVILVMTTIVTKKTNYSAYKLFLLLFDVLPEADYVA
ncbi:glycosyltransferase family 39 protein, partial [Candidatus Roizmanbacteria bacterium]|nr:glycosyltransferase family 39 protein [Candidatus Roizmanbacteria bacterium]